MLLVMVPNIVFAGACDYSNRGISRVIILLENIGRYGAVILMIVPLFMGKFGYGSVAEMMPEVIVDVVLVVSYNVVWLLFAKKKSYNKAMTLRMPANSNKL